jgi:hypothetical protein
LLQWVPSFLHSYVKLPCQNIPFLYFKPVAYVRSAVVQYTKQGHFMSRYPSCSLHMIASIFALAYFVQFPSKAQHPRASSTRHETRNPCHHYAALLFPKSSWVSANENLVAVVSGFQTTFAATGMMRTCNTYSGANDDLRNASGGFMGRGDNRVVGRCRNRGTSATFNRKLHVIATNFLYPPLSFSSLTGAACANTDRY